MRQARIESVRQCVISEAPPPQIAARSVLARARCCSLLMENVAEWIGTDPRLRQPGHPYYQGFPYVMDSEIVAEVIAVGSEVQGVHEGDRFVSYGKMNELHLFEPHSKYMDHPEFPTKGGGMAALEGKYDGEKDE